MCVIRIGGEDAEYLTIHVHGRSHPGAADYWDGNWLSCAVEVRVGAFRGTLGGSLRADELRDFLSGLEALYRRLEGEARLDAMDGWLHLQVVGDGRGHVEARGRLSEDLAPDNALEFRLFFDQTFLPPLIRQLREALAQFPVVGQGPA